MEVFDTELAEVKILAPARIGDSRGFFSEVWNRRVFAEVAADLDFVQDNHVRNPRKGTLRGLHYQVAAGGSRKADAGDARRDL